MSWLIENPWATHKSQSSWHNFNWFSCYGLHVIVSPSPRQPSQWNCCQCQRFVNPLGQAQCHQILLFIRPGIFYNVMMFINIKVFFHSFHIVLCSEGTVWSLPCINENKKQVVFMFLKGLGVHKDISDNHWSYSLHLY